MDTQALKDALDELNKLSQEEYHEPLAEVADRPGDDEETRLLRLGRLVGVTMKEPFASKQELDSPSPYGAYQAWDLKPELLNDPEERDTWQYKTLEALGSDPDVVAFRGGQRLSAYDLAQEAHNERGFFGFLAISTRRYLCMDSELRAEINREIQDAQREGLDLKNVTPELIVGSGGLALGVTLVQAIPVLAFVGAPVIAGLVFIIYKIGLDAFCSWNAEQYLVPKPGEL